MKTPTAETPTAESPADLSRQPAVAERVHTRYRFEEDGTGERVVQGAFRIQSQGGAQALGQLIYPYASANESMAILEMRVLRSDGSVEEGAHNVRDLPAPVTAQFPLYSDLHFLHVTAPPLSPGDKLEYTIRSEIHTPHAPGHFWLEHVFATGIPTLEEVIELDVPTGRKLAIHAAGLETDEPIASGDRQAYRWRRNHTPPSDDTETPAPELLVSTFESWEAVADWYRGLVADRLEPSKAMRAKVEQLTSGLDDAEAKIRAIYRHVSQEYRYLSISFGLGRFQPHQAREVFEGGYGDCKDKHTLLAALLRTIGVDARPVLISTVDDPIESVPSPTQFDHLITAIRTESGWRWLDATPSVTRLGYLVPQIRGRRALLVTADGDASLVETPRDVPFEVTNSFEFEGRLSPLGRLSGHVRQSFAGDAAVPLRLAFLAGTEEQRSEYVGQISAYQGLGREVEDVEASNPLAVDSALELSFSVDRANAWKVSGSTRRFGAPIPGYPLPEPGEDAGDDAESLELPNTTTDAYRFRVELPEGFSASAPVPVSIDRPFASYRASYRVDGQALEGERIVEMRTTEIAPADFSAWAAFRRVVESDTNQFFTLRTGAATDLAAMTDLDELFEAGRAAEKADQHDEAVQLLERVIELDEDHVDAWFRLGNAYGGLERWTDAERAFRRAGELDEYHESAFKFLGWILEEQERDGEAITAYQRQLEIDPLDHYSHDNLGELLVEQERWWEAIEHLRSADSIKPDRPSTLAGLVVAYLSAGYVEEADATKKRLLAADPSAYHLRKVALAASRLRDPDTALELYTSSIEKDPDIAWAWAGIGYAHIRREEFRQAIEPLRRAIELESNEVDYHISLGVAHAQLHEFEQAKQPLERALELEPDHPVAQESLALTYEMLGRADDAAAIGPESGRSVELLRASDLAIGQRMGMELAAARSDYEQASRALAAGDPAAALERIDRILARSSHPVLKATVAELMARSKVEVERAKKLASEAEAEILDHLARIDMATPWEEAMARWAMLQRAWAALSWAYFMELDLVRAARYLEPIVWTAGDAQLATHLGQIQEQLGQEQAAKTSYALALAGGAYTAEANNRLDALVGFQAIRPFVADTKARRLSAMTIRYRPAERKGGRARLEGLLSGEGEVLALDFRDGDAGLEPSVEELAGERFDLRLPPGKVDRLKVLLDLVCSPYAAECKLTIPGRSP